MPLRDLETLTADFLVTNVRYAFRVRNLLPYIEDIPEDIFLNYLLPYANADERRDEWRPDFYDRFIGIAMESSSVEETVVRLNGEVFRAFGLHFGTKYKASSIWSPYQSIEQGFVSCGEASVLIIDACRAVGIPARMLFLPRWLHANATHIWLEVYDNDRWRVLTAWDPARLDKGWIPGRIIEEVKKGGLLPEYRVYAVSFRETGLHIVFGTDVSVIDVTDRYLSLEKKND